MNSKRTSIFLISAIMMAVATLLFFIMQITLTTSVAYVFMILAIAMFCGGNLYMLVNPKAYPWFTVFPFFIWRYLIAQLTLSATFVLREIIFSVTFPIGVFFFLHILLLSGFSVWLLMLKSGKETIEQKDAEVKQKVSVIRLMQADVESVLRNNPAYEKQLRSVIEAIKYSDPMSNSILGVYDEQIQRGIAEMNGLNGNDSANIPEICEKLLIQIADRNSRVKLMK